MPLISDTSQKNKLKKYNINIKTKYIVGNSILERNTDDSHNDDIEKGIRCEKDYYINSKYELIIEDDANLLSSNEKQMLEEKMGPLLEYGNIDFKSIDNNPYSFAERYASNYYHSKFQTESGTLFLIDMDNREIYINSN